MKAHKYADMFPMMDDKDFNNLKEDIKDKGFDNQRPVILFNGEILDGRNRQRACDELKIKPIYHTFVGTEEEALQYVVSNNLNRRHLNPSQKAIVGVAYKKYYNDLHPQGTRTDLTSGTSSGSESREQAGEIVGVSGRMIDMAEVVQKEATPEQLESISKGKAQVTVLYKQITKAKKTEAIKKEIKEVKIENVICGNALKELKKLKDSSIGLCIIDPPYGIGFKSVRGKGTNDFEDSISLKDFEDIVIEIKRVLTKDAHFYCFIGFQTYGDYKAIIEKHFEFRNCLIWVKNNHTPTNYENNYAHKYEMIIFATKGDRPLNNKLSVDVLEYDNIQGKQHNSEKPVDLLKYLIENSSNEKEVVLDCFAGSGSTLVAAQQLKRNWIGIELQEEFCDIIKYRIKEVTK